MLFHNYLLKKIIDLQINNLNQYMGLIFLVVIGFVLVYGAINAKNTKIAKYDIKIAKTVVSKVKDIVKQMEKEYKAEKK